ncbi:MAG: hypothetical protein SVK54_03765 [candidate division WOR-3 bacterium]|nr:hypothetical protein [candidate division WOR-3 bacterium]
MFQKRIREEQIQSLAEDLLVREDFSDRHISLKSIEIKRGRSIMIRIFLDRENGITIDDLSDFHKEFQLILQAESIWNDDLQMQVSSPGHSAKK